MQENIRFNFPRKIQLPKIEINASLKNSLFKILNKNTPHSETQATSKEDQHDAFICYSTKNESFANKLENILESYKPPTDLKVPQRHLNIFRDKRDFEIGDYPEKRDKHLKSSAKLIVICSPDARKSEYVNDEISKFAEFKGSDNIIPVLLSGIPNNEARPGQEPEMAFPEALSKLMVMPLAINYSGVDVKKDKLDKAIFSDQWFSLLTAIYSISRSEVEQREKRRRVRKRKITYSILGGSILILSVLLILVWVSRNEAIDRKLAAEAARLDAIASQMFAESRRSDALQEIENKRLSQLKEDERTEMEKMKPGDTLTLRLANLTQEISQTEDELDSLELQGIQYRKKGKDSLFEADKIWSKLQRKRENWVAERSRPFVPTIFSLEILNAKSNGECLILHFGELDQPKFILIGGGMNYNYSDILKPRLSQIKNKWNPKNSLPIELVIASQLDVQSIGGLIAMTNELISDQIQNKPAFLSIATIWYNSFQPLPEQWSKTRLTLNAKKLNIHHNKPFDHFVMRPDSGAISLNKDSLKIIVIHPTAERIQKLGKYWVSQAKKRTDTTVEVKLVIEKFSNPALTKIVPSRTPLDKSILLGDRDNSIPNLSSMCLIFEMNNKKLLYTGDAVGDDILKGLHAANNLSTSGTTHFDVLILPHSASDRNVNKYFFERVTADHYVILGDGTHDNPEVTTLTMLEEARAGNRVSLYFANRDGQNNLGNKLDQYFLTNTNWAKLHRRIFRRNNEHNLILNILEPVRY